MIGRMLTIGLQNMSNNADYLSEAGVPVAPPQNVQQRYREGFEHEIR